MHKNSQSSLKLLFHNFVLHGLANKLDWSDNFVICKIYFHSNKGVQVTNNISTLVVSSFLDVVKIELSVILNKLRTRSSFITI